MKKLICFLLAVIMVVSLAACESAKTETKGETNTSVSYPLTVTDQAGREVTIKSEPKKIISGYYISTSVLIALDLDEKMVGIESKAEKRAIYKLASPELLNLQQVGTAKELDIEACVALEPDLLILPIKLKSVISTLEELGLTVIFVDPENQEKLNSMIELIGTATNKNKEAESLLGFISNQQSYLTETLKSETAPTVYLAGNSSLLSTAGENMYQSDMIRLAGGVNVANEIEDDYWSEIDYEQLLAWNPEYIILAADASYTVEDVLSDPNLSSVEAVKNGNVYIVPNNAEAWDSPVPSSILGAIWLSNILHPEKVSNDECLTRINNYYETFYNFTYSEK